MGKKAKDKKPGAWKSTAYPGIRYREHPTRKLGGIPDRYYVIRLMVNGVRREEPVGWTSEGVRLDEVVAKWAEIKRAGRTGEGPRSLREMREANERKRQAEIEAEEERARSAMTVSEFWNAEYFPHAKASKADRAWKAEGGLYRLWIEPIVGALPMRDVSIMALERVKRSMLDAGKSARSVEYALAVVRQIFNRGIACGVFRGVNPVSASKVRAPRVDNRRDGWLRADQAERLLKELEYVPDVRDMALLSLHAGLRFGEIAALRWGDVDITSEILAVRDTKSGRNRHVPMMESVKAMFERRYGRVQVSVDLVFPDRAGKERKQVPDSFNRAVERAGINNEVVDRRGKIVFHSLRHTFASWLVEKEVPLYVVSELLGHTSLLMTARYSHHAPDTLRAAVAKLPSMETMTENTAEERSPLRWPSCNGECNPCMMSRF